MATETWNGAVLAESDQPMTAGYQFDLDVCQAASCYSHCVSLAAFGLAGCVAFYTHTLEGLTSRVLTLSWAADHGVRRRQVVSRSVQGT